MSVHRAVTETEHNLSLWSAGEKSEFADSKGQPLKKYIVLYSFGTKRSTRYEVEG